MRNRKLQGFATHARKKSPPSPPATRLPWVVFFYGSPCTFLSGTLPRLVHVLILCRPKTSQSGHINSSPSYVPKKSTVPEASLLSCLLTAFLAAPSPSGCSLSPETEKVDSLKSFLKQSPRPVRVAAILSACCELSTETNFQKSQPSPTSILHCDLSTATCPAAPGLQCLCFFSGALPKPRPVPETKRGTKI